MKTALVSVFLFALLGSAVAQSEEPIEASVCQLKQNPAAYNHKLVVTTAFVSHAFEDFTFFDPACPLWPRVWLEYGGTAKSGTMYCCGVTADRRRPRELVIENVHVPLLMNEQFHAFDKAIQPPFRSGRQGAVVHAKLVGRFFAGVQEDPSRRNSWGGFGHMGCCTLFAIQEVKSADTENRKDLDYGAYADQPDLDKVGCGYRFLIPPEATGVLLRWQQETELGKHAWAFDDPQRVAVEALAQYATISADSIKGIKLARQAQGRKIFEWRSSENKKRYLVVVSRPYWVSFYSHDRKQIAWVAIAAYESSCEGKNSVTRIK